MIFGGRVVFVGGSGSCRWGNGQHDLVRTARRHRQVLPALQAARAATRHRRSGTIGDCAQAATRVDQDQPAPTPDPPRRATLAGLDRDPGALPRRVRLHRRATTRRPHPATIPAALRRVGQHLGLRDLPGQPRRLRKLLPAQRPTRRQPRRSPRPVCRRSCISALEAPSWYFAAGNDCPDRAIAHIDRPPAVFCSARSARAKCCARMVDGSSGVIKGPR